MYSPINENCFFNALWMLRLSNLTWIKVIANGDVPSTRYAHAATTIDTKLIIFGGLNSKLYSRGFLSLCELNKMTVKAKIIDYEAKLRDEKYKGKNR